GVALLAARKPGDKGQIAVRIPQDLLRQLDAYVDRLGEDRSTIVRQALGRLLADEFPARDHVVQAVKPAYQDAVERAFRDEGEWWTPLSEAWFLDLPAAAVQSAGGAVVARVLRPELALREETRLKVVRIEWRGTVSSPAELYETLRKVIKEARRVAAPPEA